MIMILNSFVVFALAGFVLAEKCPSGGEIYARGISEAGKQEVVDIHNNYRKQIANGQVTGQPRGINLKKLIYDDPIGKQGKLVSDTCKMEHVDGTDARFPSLGQNLYITWSPTKNPGQNWTKAAYSWFKENKDFTYPDKSNGVTGHYTQVVWAETTHIGCDFIEYEDKTMADNPYAQLYTCNYAPGGSSGAPYKTGASGCEDLC